MGETTENPLAEGLERLPVHPTSLVIFGGKEYGSGSSRDWAAKGTSLLGVKAVIVESFERIHRSNLIGMGVLPLQFPPGESAASLGLDGTETYDISGVTALPERFHLVGVSRSEVPDAEFRTQAAAAVTEFSRREADPKVLEALFAEARYVSGSFDDETMYPRLCQALDDFDELAGQKLNRAFYLSTAPKFFPVIVEALGEHGLTENDGAEVRVIIEKPFGTTLQEAHELNKTVLGAVGDVDLVLFVVEAGKFTPADAKVLALLKPGIPALLVANKLDEVHRRGDVAPWLQEMQQRHAFTEFVPMSAEREADVERLFKIVEPYLPQQAWLHEADALTDRSDRFLASELVREKLFRLTGEELPYTSTVVIDKYEEEGNLRRISATIVVEREAHKGMIIGEGGERLKRIGSEARQELERLLEAKVFLELWVKVRSGWADDERHLRSYGYE